MKVLVVSHESWNSKTNGGNVLTNIFSGFDWEFRQIYCSAGIPENNICDDYYQITDKMVLDNVLKRKKVGKRFKLSETIETNTLDEKFETTSKKRRWQIIFMAREIVWSLSKIDNDDFINFIKEYEPDIVFAPCYGNPRMLRLTRIINKYTAAPIISYVSDDLYSYKALEFNPLYWIRRWNLRRHVRETFKLYKLVYTMTKEQLIEYINNFNVPMKILRKGCIPGDINKFYKPYRIIYAGGIYLNRVNILIELANIIKKINEDGIKFILDIYSNGELNSEEKEILDNQIDTYYHGLISPEQLIKEYDNSSIALHVESFDLKNSLITRLSFSTKITDCLQSGAAVMAICPEINAGFKYLLEEDSAICISNLDELETTLRNIFNEPEILTDYALKARECIIKNHNPLKNKEMIADDFHKYALSVK